MSTPTGLIQAGVVLAILVVLSSAIEDTAHVDEQLAVGEGAMPAHLVQVIEPLITEQVGKYCRGGGGGGLLGESGSIRSSVLKPCVVSGSERPSSLPRVMLRAPPL